ncbi:MAG: hypothetical protein F4185_03885 [Chloroflexi bacterium]|nr:hypothetical protein [Chloroflexota bacterium]MYF65074.1 hypothetical protein [Chloroflexota bacterium]MYK35871.1 hypothetical protein [Chloroflexota bacterium]
MLQKVTDSKSDSLSQRQLMALPYIVAEPTISEGARAAGIARMTLTRWMRDPAFREELERVRRNIAEFAFNELEGLTIKCVVRLQQLLDDPDPNVRHRALKTGLSTSINFRNQKEVQHKLELIEMAQVMMRQQR